MRTTLNIDDRLLAEAKIIAARAHRSLGSIVEDALRVLLAERGRTSQRSSVSLPVGCGSRLKSGIDLEDKEQLAEVLGDNRLNHVDH